MPCTAASKVSRNTVQRRLRLFLQFNVIRIKRVSYGESSSPRTTKKSGNISRYFLRYIENSTLLGIISQQISFSRLDDDAESGKRLRRLLNLTWWKFELLSHMYMYIVHWSMYSETRIKILILAIKVMLYSGFVIRRINSENINIWKYNIVEKIRERNIFFLKILFHRFQCIVNRTPLKIFITYFQKTVAYLYMSSIFNTV